MKCPDCGKEIADGSLTCEYCGVQIPAEMNVFPTVPMSIVKKVLIGIFAAYSVFAFVMLINNASMRGWYIFSMIAAFMMIAAIWMKFKLDNKPFQIREPNGVKPGTLKTVMFIGHSLRGNFRKYKGTHVAYSFFVFGIPLFPTGCYRVKLVRAKRTSSTSYKEEWMIYGSEKSSGLELLYIYLITLGGVFWVSCAMIAISSVLVLSQTS